MLIPIGRENRDRHIAPWVVRLILVLNILVFLVELAGGDEFIAAFATVPYEF